MTPSHLSAAGGAGASSASCCLALRTISAASISIVHRRPWLNKPDVYRQWIAVFSMWFVLYRDVKFDPLIDLRPTTEQQTTAKSEEFLDAAIDMTDSNKAVADCCNAALIWTRRCPI